MAMLIEGELHSSICPCAYLQRASNMAMIIGELQCLI